MTDIDRQWAASQVEAMADGSLTPADARRMRAAMAREPALRSAVEHAIALRGALARLAGSPVPRPLLWRLLAIPQRNPAARPPRRRQLAWGLAGVAAAAVALAATLLQHRYDEREREAAEAFAQAQALAQVELAMAYLQESSAIAGAHLAEALRTSMRAAAATSRKAMRDDEEQSDGG